MKKFKQISLLLAIAMLVAALAGCTNSYAPDPVQDAGTADSGDDAPAPDAGSAAASDGEALSMMYNGTETDTAFVYYNQVVDSFNATNEFGVSLNIEFYENEQYKTKLTTLMAANNVTDLFFTWELDYLRPFVDGGKVLDITDMLDADTELKESFQEGLVDTLTYGDRVYALPTQSCFTPMFYNTRIFEDNSLTPPETWEDFLQICETLNGNDITPLVVQASDAWIPAQLVQHLVNGIGGLEVYNGLLNGTVDWNNDTHVEAGRVLQTLVDAGYMQDGFLGMKQEEGRKIFMDGNAAMYFMGSWEISTLIQESSATYGEISAFILPPVDPQYPNLLVGSVDSSIAISSQTKHPEAAFALLKHWLNTENQETLLYDYGRLPATRIDVDRGRVNSLTADCLDIADQIQGMSPWLDRAFGAGEGVEFNNTVLSICGGEDPQTAFDNLQRYVEDTVSNS